MTALLPWLVAILLAWAAPGAAAPPSPPPRVIVAYHDSWAEPAATNPALTSISRLPAYVDILMLAFARPDLTYANDLDLAGTGLEYRMGGETLRAAIAALRQRNPGVKVLLSVGGATYRGWRRLNLDGIVALVRDLGLDGIDWDYEPNHPDCRTGADGHITCVTDRSWEALVSLGRTALPRPALITVSAWSVGAYGEGAFAQAQPRSPYTGSMLWLRRSPLAREIDLVSINAYDAGPTFNPREAFEAYRAIWPGRLALGVEVRYTGGAGPFPTLTQAETLARAVARDPMGGMMLYAWLMKPPKDAGYSPDGAGLAGALCRGMARTGCDAVP